MLPKRANFVPSASPLTLPAQLCRACTIRTRQQQRHLHARIPIPPTPKPTPFVPDAATFLKLIGRGLSAHASKFETWESLFTTSSTQLRTMGIEPTRTRRYLLRWREKFRQGEFGVGGTLKHVNDEGVAEVRTFVVPIREAGAASSSAGTSATAEGETETKATSRPRTPLASLTADAGMRTIVANVAQDHAETLSERELARGIEKLEGVKLLHGSTIAGPHVELVAGSGGTKALIRAKEGMWEHRRGQKVDGGERRKAMVRAKRRSAERKAAMG